MSKMSPGNDKNWSSARRWTPAQARAALSALASSGDSVAAFAARHGIDVQRVHAWRRRLGGAMVTAGGFVEVRATRSEEHEKAFDVELSSGDRVRVPADFDPAALRRLVAILRRTTAC